MHMIPHRTRDADAAHWAFRLQSGCDVHAIAMEVSAIGNHVADVDADAEANASVRCLIAVTDWHLLLHLDRAAHSTIDAVEGHQKRIAASLRHSATVFVDGWVDQNAPQRAQTAQCAGVIRADQAAIADHVGIDDSNQLTAARGLAGEVRADLSRTHEHTLTHPGASRRHPEVGRTTGSARSSRAAYFHEATNTTDAETRKSSPTSGALLSPKPA